MRIGKGILIVLPVVLVSLLAGATFAAQAAPTVDLSNAVVVTASGAADRVERQAALMLRTEVQNRTGINWKEVHALPGDDTPAIVVGSLARMPAVDAAAAGMPMPVMKDGEPAAEGYVLRVNTTMRAAPTVFAIGNDKRGTLYAVGRLLRALRWWPGHVEVEAGIKMASAPATKIRGMQLGYRQLNDTVDAWDVGDYAQYVRDLIVWGNNAIELIPGLYPGAPKPADPDPLMPLTTWDMTVSLSAVLDAYDMDVWFWLPLALRGTPEDRTNTLRERASLFAACKRIDHVFVPGGDPGDTPPQVLMPYLEELAAVLRKHHPNAGLWVSTQGFEPEYLEYFYEYLQENEPDFLTGVVFGPWGKDTLEHTRQAVPEKYPIRRYPDITHTVRNQYPFPRWDEVWHQAYERQPIHPRPTQYAHVCNVLRQYADGAICYSDGTGDDVNKIIWNVMMWNPKADVRSALIQYGRYFVGQDFAEGVADGILMLEKNWTQPALTSPQVPKTLAHWQAMERRATPQTMASWRFQQGLLRSYVDAYVQARVKQEDALLQRAYAEMAKASEAGVEAALDAAEAILKQANPLTAAPPLRARIFELADMINETSGMQLGIERHGANRPDRGAVLDTMDTPLTDGAWLLASEFPKIREMEAEVEQLAYINRLLNWEDPGPGGFYDDLGNGANGKDPHLVRAPGWEQDPGYVVCPRDSHGGPDFPEEGRLSWTHQAESLFWTPVRMRYTGLDPNAAYLFKATYTGRFSSVLQLYFDDEKIGEPLKADRHDPQVYEFEVPKSATADGALDVKWEKVEWEGREGRGVQVAEAWLIKKQ